MQLLHSSSIIKNEWINYCFSTVCEMNETATARAPPKTTTESVIEVLIILSRGEKAREWVCIRMNRVEIVDMNTRSRYRELGQRQRGLVEFSLLSRFGRTGWLVGWSGSYGLELYVVGDLYWKGSREQWGDHFKLSFVFNLRAFRAVLEEVAFGTWFSISLGNFPCWEERR